MNIVQMESSTHIFLLEDRAGTNQEIYLWVLVSAGNKFNQGIAVNDQMFGGTLIILVCHMQFLTAFCSRLGWGQPWSWF
jgi:hypothetical protein